MKACMARARAKTRVTAKQLGWQSEIDDVPVWHSRSDPAKLAGDMEVARRGEAVRESSVCSLMRTHH